MSKNYITERSVPNYASNLILEDGCAFNILSVAAAGTNQATGTVLRGSSRFTVTGANGTKTVTLSAPVGNQPASGLEVQVYNSGASALPLYPPVGGAFNGGATNASVTIPAGGQATFTQYSSTLWLGTVSTQQSGSSVTGVFSAQSVAAAGTTQADATAITAAAPATILATAANATKGVLLPAATAGSVYFLKNDDAANAILKVWPASTNTINAIAASTNISMAAKTAAVFMCVVDGAWYTIPLLPS